MQAPENAIGQYNRISDEILKLNTLPERFHVMDSEPEHANEILMNNMNDDKWIGIDEAADYLGVNKDFIRSWIKKDCEIPAQKTGKQWKFK